MERDAKAGKVAFIPRTVLIDMEPKVIAKSLASAQQCKLWQYSEKQHFSQKSGSGNNWAHGYCVHGSKHDTDIEELVQHQVEECDRYIVTEYMVE